MEISRQVLFCLQMILVVAVVAVAVVAAVVAVVAVVAAAAFVVSNLHYFFIMMHEA